MKVRHIFGNGVYSKEIEMDAEDYIEKHTHSFDHISFLSIGAVEVKAGNKISQYTGPIGIKIEAGVKHSVTALTDCKWYCMHITDECDPDKIDHVLMEY
jgi:quercetin dioxygenase-like cupin family protein